MASDNTPKAPQRAVEPNPCETRRASLLPPVLAETISRQQRRLGDSMDAIALGKGSR
jgi:hypothetical protein